MQSSIAVFIRFGHGTRRALGSTGECKLTDVVDEAEKAILRYLIGHREARDTIEGIERWWLPQSKEYGLKTVAEALQRLESRNLICVWKSASAKPVYGLRSYDLDSLRGYLRGLE